MSQNLAVGVERNESSGKEYLVFILAEQEYGIDILKVQEIRGYEAKTVTSIANVPQLTRCYCSYCGFTH